MSADVDCVCLRSEKLQQGLEWNEPNAEALQASGGIDWDTGEGWILKNVWVCV